jgi:hypothetical protein
VSPPIRSMQRSARVRSSDLELKTWRDSNKSVRVCSSGVYVNIRMNLLGLADRTSFAS